MIIILPRPPPSWPLLCFVILIGGWFPVPSSSSTPASFPLPIKLGTEESYTCANADPWLSTWSNIRSVFGYDREMALLVSFYLDPSPPVSLADAHNPKLPSNKHPSKEGNYKQVYEVRFKLPHSYLTQPVYAIDLMMIETISKYSDKNSNLYHQQLKHSKRNARYFNYLNENLLLIVLTEDKSDKESYIVYDIRNDSILSSIQLSLQNAYIPIYHFQLTSNVSNPNYTKPDPCEFPMSIIGIKDFSIEYGIFHTKPTPKFNSIQTKKYYFGFDLQMKRILMSRNRSNLTPQKIPNYIAPEQIFTESQWHAFLFHKHIYLLNGNWVLYFKNYNLDRLSASSGTDLLEIPMEVMHNNTMFRCGGVSADIVGSGSELKVVPRFPPDIFAFKKLMSLISLIVSFLAIASVLIGIVWLAINYNCWQSSRSGLSLLTSYGNGSKSSPSGKSSYNKSEISSSSASSDTTTTSSSSSIYNPKLSGSIRKQLSKMHIPGSSFTSGFGTKESRKV